MGESRTGLPFVFVSCRTDPRLRRYRVAGRAAAVVNDGTIANDPGLFYAVRGRRCVEVPAGDLSEAADKTISAWVKDATSILNGWQLDYSGSGSGPVVTLLDHDIPVTDRHVADLWVSPDRSPLIILALSLGGQGLINDLHAFGVPS